MPWYITGSEALAVYGAPRQTMARSLYRLNSGALDLTYLEAWAGRLGLNELLGRMRAEAADAP